MRRVIVLGGGAAGYAAAQTLIEAIEQRPEVSIALISDRPEHVVRPLLTEVTVGAISPQATRVALSRLADRGRIDLFNERVVAIEPEPGVVRTEQVSHAFDYLLVALGNEPAIPPSWSGNKALFSYRDDADALRLRERLEQVAAAEAGRVPTVCIVGGGPVGVELAATLSEGGLPGSTAAGESSGPVRCRVHLLERADRLLGDFPEEFGEYAFDVLTHLGANVRLSAEAVDLEDGRIGLTGGGVIEADAVVWAGGERPVPVVRALAEDLYGREALVVDKFLRLAGYANAFVAGANVDQTRLRFDAPDLFFGDKSGRAAARNLLAAMAGRAPERVSGPSNAVAVPVGRGRAIAMVMGVIVKDGAGFAVYRAALARLVPRMLDRLSLWGAWANEAIRRINPFGLFGE